jgi:hypothetical protein
VTITRLRRTGYAAISGLTGWLVAQVLCLPILLITGVRDTEGQVKLFVQTMFYGILAWGGWTFLLGFVAWVLVVLPLVMAIRPCLLVRMRHVIVALATVFALWLAARKPDMFKDPTGASFLHRFGSAIPYIVYAVGFTVVTAWMYILLSKRWLERPDVDASVPPSAEREPKTADAPS